MVWLRQTIAFSRSSEIRDHTELCLFVGARESCYTHSTFSNQNELDEAFFIAHYMH